LREFGGISQIWNATKASLDECR